MINLLIYTSIGLLLAMCMITVKWQGKPREPVTLAFAKLLLSIGRWFWSSGKAVEAGYRYHQKVKASISLEEEESS